MNSQREFGEHLRLSGARVARFKAPSGPIEPPAQRELFVGIAKFTQEQANFVGAPVGVADGA
jgi:hypothetical protein